MVQWMCMYIYLVEQDVFQFLSGGSHNEFIIEAHLPTVRAIEFIVAIR